MKKGRHTILLIGLFFWHALQSQNLSHEIKYNFANDTTLINALICNAHNTFNQELIEQYWNNVLVLSQKGIEHYKASHPLGRRARFYKTSALIFYASRDFYKSNFKKSIETSFQVIDIAREIKDTSILGTIYSNLGIYYSQANEEKIALGFYVNALKLSKKTSKNGDIFYSYFHIAESCYRLKLYNKAFYYYKNSLIFAKKANNGYFGLLAYSGIGNLYQKIGFTDSAYKYLKKSLKLSEKIADSVSIADNLISLAEISFAENKINDADYYLREARKHLPKPNKQIEIYGNLMANSYQLNLLKSNYREAIKSYTILSRIRDSINKTAIKVSLFQKELELENKDKARAERAERRRLLADIKKQNELRQKSFWLILGYTALTLSVFIIVLIFTLYKIRQKKNRVEQEKLSTELAFLRSQINPHFLFNCINNLYFQIDKKNNLARNTLHGFSEILRYQLYDCERPTVPIEKEIDYLKNYVGLQLQRKDKQIDFAFYVDQAVKNFDIAPLLIIPFIENAFKYISQKINSTNRLFISLSKENTWFLVNIANDTDVLSKNVKGSSGIGIQNVKRRLELLYPGKHTLNIEHKENAFNVLLKIDLS